MITSQQVIEVLETYDGHSLRHIEVDNDGSVRSFVVNRLDPGRPYTLHIRWLYDGQVLGFRIRWPYKLQLDSTIPKTLLQINGSLGFGYLAIDGKYRVVYAFNYVCREDDDKDPPPELLKTILDKMVGNLPSIDKALVAGRMADAGFSEDTAKSITRVLFSRGKNNRTSADGRNGA